MLPLILGHHPSLASQRRPAVVADREFRRGYRRFDPGRVVSK